MCSCLVVFESLLKLSPEILNCQFQLNSQSVLLFQVLQNFENESGENVATSFGVSGRCLCEEDAELAHLVFDFVSHAVKICLGIILPVIKVLFHSKHDVLKLQENTWQFRADLSEGVPTLKE